MQNKEQMTAILVDDEKHNLNVLKTLLKKHCAEVRILDEAENVIEAYEKILNLKPQLLFLDIKMPEKSGFDLLKMFQKIDFEVIFVSAFNEYAITAFEFNALDYILKPIDYCKLIKAVNKASTKRKSNSAQENVLHFIKTIDEKTDLINKFSVHHNDKVIFCQVSDVAYIESQHDFCCINLGDGTRYTSSKDLGSFEEVLRPLGHFIRISKSCILNSHFIKGYSKGEPCIIDLKSGKTFEVSRRKKTEILQLLRTLLG